MKTPKTSTFVSRLYSLLDDDTYADVVEWCKQGENFVIKDLKLFKTRLLNSYFTNINYPSFARQLKMYGFSQVSDARTQKLPSGQRWFRHPQFHKGNKDQLFLVKRIATTKPSALIIPVEPEFLDPICTFQHLNSPALTENYSTFPSAQPSSPLESKSCKFCARGMNTEAYLFLHACAVSPKPAFESLPTSRVGSSKLHYLTPPQSLEGSLDFSLPSQYSYNIFPRHVSPSQLHNWDEVELKL
ncbi:kinase-regulated stress-responsive transcription factor skn7 [Entomophthora muscae]|uniref:Kinase-regulated stress-responsive transcription factor skn7 n=1 Tax=Entomophthora muscae TaxID=34485 RepID=A0ACC2SZP9_9FUNG|nr:kinase-regulated stress-responsive transcription factor skn7 [Entomophthora muscae]